jgi:hypothetical protein
MLIDPSIRDWVMIPILALVILSVFVRMYAMKLLSDAKPVDKDEAVQRATIARSARLRANGGYISHAGFVMRRAFLGAGDGTGKLEADIANKNPMASNPMAQMDMMKQQVSGWRLGGGLGRGKGLRWAHCRRH